MANNALMLEMSRAEMRLQDELKTIKEVYASSKAHYSKLRWVWPIGHRRRMAELEKWYAELREMSTKIYAGEIYQLLKASQRGLFE